MYPPRPIDPTIKIHHWYHVRWNHAARPSQVHGQLVYTDSREHAQLIVRRSVLRRAGYAAFNIETDAWISDRVEQDYAQPRRRELMRQVG